MKRKKITLIANKESIRHYIKEYLTIYISDCNADLCDCEISQDEIGELKKCYDYNIYNYDDIEKIINEEVAIFAKKNNYKIASALDNKHCKLCGNVYVYYKGE